MSGFAILRYNPSGQEAVVPLETGNAPGYVLVFDSTNGLATGLALANVSTQAANVPVTLRDDAGITIGIATINLPAQGRTSFVLTDQYASTAGLRGSAEFDAPTSTAISVLGLRATPTGVVTTVPAIAKEGPGIPGPLPNNSTRARTETASYIPDRFARSSLPRGSAR